MMMMFTQALIGPFETPQLVFNESENVGWQRLLQRKLIGFLYGRFSRQAIRYSLRQFRPLEAALAIQPVKVDLSGDSFIGDRSAAETNDFSV
jgi:hypothetical protein